jgi:NADPH:quinone reductase-like Zn-dependent oxidoreductase
VKGLGADAIFDYNDPDCGEMIRKHTADELTHVVDTMSKGSTGSICAAAVSKSKGGTIVTLLPYETDIGRSDVEVKLLLSLSLLGDEYEWGPQKFQPNPEDFEFGVSWYQEAEKLLTDKKIKVHTTSLQSGGLKGVFDGMQQMREGKVSGVKLVYKL